MKLIVKVQDVSFILTPDQVSSIVAVIADAQVLTTKYLGSSVPEAARWKKLITPVVMDDVKFAAMDDVSYGALQLVSKLHFEAEASK